MFCFKCGKEIEDLSKFCNFCGTSLQVIKGHSISFDKKKWHGFLSIPLKIHLSNLNLGIYTTWLLINFIFLISMNGNTRYIFPFSYRSGITDYGLPEFILFTVVPVVVYIIIFLFADSKISVPGNLDYSINSPLIKETTTPTLVGLLTLIIINVLRFGFDEKLLNISVSFIFVISIRIIVSIWISRIAEKLNRKVVVWVFFGFLFPSFALLLINHKRRIEKDI